MKSIKVNAIINKNNKQMNFYLKKSLMSKKFLKDFKNIHSLKIKIEDWE